MQKLKTLLVDDQQTAMAPDGAASLCPSGSLLCRPGGYILSVDPAAFNLLGLGRRFAAPRDVEGAMLAEIAEWPADTRFDDLIRSDRPVACVRGPVRTLSGDATWLVLDARPEGEAVRVSLVDVTSYRQQHSELRQEHAFFENVIRNLSVPTFVIGADRRVILWNRACEELTGLSSAQVIGTGDHSRIFHGRTNRTLADVVAEGDVRDVGTLYDVTEKSAILADGWRAEGWFDHLNGRRRYLVLDAAPIRGTGGELLAVVQAVEDITEHKLAHEKLRQQSEQLCELQKMEALSRLAGGIAHEFNNLLTAILGYANLIGEGLGEGHPLRADAAEIAAAGERAAALTDQLLTLARRHPARPALLNLNAVVIEIGRLLRRTLGEDVEFSVECDSKLAPIKADEGIMEQVLMNLAVNAKDALSGGGKLTIQTSTVTLDRDYHEGDQGISSGRYVALRVRDTGHGMTEEVRAHIFEPFFTTKERGKGTGLGLSMVYGVVQQLGGWIDVSSQPGVGTSVTLYIPAVDVPGESEEETLRPAELPGGKETILVVEDEESLRKLVVRSLSSLGYRILEAGDGKDGLRLAEQYPGRIDLVLSDVVMPQMGGHEMIRRLRAIRHDFRVLFSSGFTSGALVEHGMLDGTDEVILKPFTRKSLARRVRDLLDSRS